MSDEERLKLLLTYVRRALFTIISGIEEFLGVPEIERTSYKLKSK